MEPPEHIRLPSLRAVARSAPKPPPPRRKSEPDTPDRKTAREQARTDYAEEVKRDLDSDRVPHAALLAFNLTQHGRVVHAFASWAHKHTRRAVAEFRKLRVPDALDSVGEPSADSLCFTLPKPLWDVMGLTRHDAVEKLADAVEALVHAIAALKRHEDELIKKRLSAAEIKTAKGRPFEVGELAFVHALNFLWQAEHEHDASRRPRLTAKIVKIIAAYFELETASSSRDKNTASRLQDRKWERALRTARQPGFSAKHREASQFVDALLKASPKRTPQEVALAFLDAGATPIK